MKDGDPCIAASPYADIAIFRAIVNDVNFSDYSYSSNFGVEGRDGKETVKLGASLCVTDNLAGKKGVVYVFNRDGFRLHEAGVMEWRCDIEMAPSEKIEVCADDIVLLPIENLEE